MTERKEPWDRQSPPRASGAKPRPSVARHDRPDIADGFFGVVWPLDRKVQVPSLARRALALAADLVMALPLLAASVAIVEVTSNGGLLRIDAMVRSVGLFVLLLSVAFAWWESSESRATPGKILFDIRVATATEKPMRFGDALMRFWLRLATLLTANAGCWLAWHDTRGQALHDRLCGTWVIAHHVTAGQLRSVQRAPAAKDFVAAVAVSALAYGLVFVSAPAFVRNLDIADRFESAIVELAPVIAADELVDGEGRWSRSLRTASLALDDLRVSVDVEGRSELVLRARVPDRAPAALEVRLERQRAEGWTCSATGIVFYASPRNCTPVIGEAPEARVSLETIANPG